VAVYPHCTYQHCAEQQSYSSLSLFSTEMGDPMY